ncbi:uncharacterized protein LOC127811011 isoform X2 [Diospyros lotus]|uniref:uncharacterized protein LOC127811011 isoform X2 n=1 Tax=Diospyros lotus TaxID=55363 RepID=UPI0022594643|nr:uncharacterized protein LOC127811011 isoform X2 [Diospyros lotus]
MEEEMWKREVEVVESSEEELRRRRLEEEALEVKSLRRIISAYLNYPDAAEEDVKRYEKSFRRLPPAHKALLSHLPIKFQKLRWCISKNSFFIFNMLQAFEPPIDMSRDIDICDHQNLKNTPDSNPFSVERNVCSCPSDLTDGRVSLVESDETSCGEASNLTCQSPHKEVKTVQFNGPSAGNCSAPSECDKSISEAGGNNVETIINQATSSVNDLNQNVSSSPPDWLDPSFQLHVPLVDVDKVRCIIRNIVRDWAAEGQKERDQCYKPILEELQVQFPDRRKESPPACLVPGAGLGRLALEISCLGFISQGNEFSYYMMICSNYILNQTQTAGEWTIYPWIHSNCNSLSDSDQLRPVPIPDIHPASAGITEGFSMCGGDFVEVYSDPSQVGVWDAVVTCFFLDTAHNIVEYIEIISRVLKYDGVWINLGPLLYHFADMYGQGDEMSIELSLEDVKRISFHYGFELEKEESIETTYTTNPQSMMQNRYYTAFWVMRKKGAFKETTKKEQQTP